MFGLRILPLLLLSLTLPLAAQADEIMSLSIPAPDQLGTGSVFNSGNGGIIWNGPRLTAPTAIMALTPLVTVAPAAQTQPQVQPYAKLASAPYALQDNSLFGHRGVVSRDTSAFTKWNDVVVREQRELNGPHNAQTVSWLAFLQTLQGQSRDAQLEAVNDYANRIAYISDQDNYGQADYWATTGEFLARGGDCEDYAIAKYMSLQMLGFDTSHMRVVILFDQNKQERHAVLAIDDGNSVKILDNQSRRIVAAIDIDHYQPIYAISQTGWWRYV